MLGKIGAIQGKTIMDGWGCGNIYICKKLKNNIGCGSLMLHVFVVVRRVNVRTTKDTILFSFGMLFWYDREHLL